MAVVLTLALAGCSGSSDPGDDATWPREGGLVEKTPPPSPTASPPAPAPTATLEPRFYSAEQLPQPQWVEVAEDYLFERETRLRLDLFEEIYVDPSLRVVVDTSVRKVWRINQPRLGHGDLIFRIAAWSVDGQAVVLPAVFGGALATDYFSGVLLGSPEGPWRALDLGEPFRSATGGAFSPDGKTLAVEVQRDIPTVYFVDTETLRVIDKETGRSVAFSGAGAYRLVVQPISDTATELAVRNLETSAEERLSGSGGMWSPLGNALAYTKVMPPDSVTSVFLHDFDAGTETELVPAAWVHSCSLDGRYLAVFEEGPQSSFLIVGRSGRVLVRVTGAWPGGWLEDGRFFDKANVCGSFDIFFVDPESGSASRYAADILAAGAYAAASPEGGRIAFMRSGVGHLFIRDLEGGFVLSMLLADFYLPFEARARPLWSPDGRYLVLSPLPLKEGPCFADSGTPGLATTVEVMP